MLGKRVALSVSESPNINAMSDLDRPTNWLSPSFVGLRDTRRFLLILKSFIGLMISIKNHKRIIRDCFDGTVSQSGGRCMAELCMVAALQQAGGRKGVESI